MIDDIYNKFLNDRYFYWLGLDFWGIEHAAWLLLDIDPDSIEDNGSEIYKLKFAGTNECYFSDVRDGGIPFDEEIEKQHVKIIDKFVFVFHKYIALLKDKIIGKTEQEIIDFRAPPAFWINKAISKNIEIPWLNYVIQKGYYNPNEVIKEKELTNKERETLLIIIAALAKEAKVDINKISKAGELIANMTQIIGAPIGATTIETHLKKIPEAQQIRAK